MDGTPLAGTFMKTPAVDVLEVLILGGLDFVCLDAEHAPFDRAALNGLCAVARAADFPVLVRVPSGSAEQIGMALDAGAHGIVVPHVTDKATAERVARAARFGPGGRGYAGLNALGGLCHACHARPAGGGVPRRWSSPRSRTPRLSRWSKRSPQPPESTRFSWDPRTCRWAMAMTRRTTPMSPAPMRGPGRPRAPPAGPS
jgi:hypothetical protein